MDKNAIANQLLKDIDQYAVDNYGQAFNRRLPVSIIGNDCKRYLWYKFRWFQKSERDGRSLRLTKRGDLEEFRLQEYLRGIGMQTWFYDTNATQDEQGRYPQYRMSGVMGHFGGSLDGIGILPPKYGVEMPFLLECKTNGTGAAFNKIVTVGMQQAKPDHFIANSIYGKNYGLSHALYFNTNKNDDSMHIEVVELDFGLAKLQEQKAELVIMAREPLPRISEKAEYHKCMVCEMKPVCKDGKEPEINCRSCKHSKPVENTEWYCEVHKANIPAHIIKTGCEQYELIK